MTSTPGAAGWRKLRPNSANCDTAAMTQLSRWLARYELVRTAAFWLTLALLAMLAAFAFASYYSKPTPGAIAAAAALIALGGAGLTYAWRAGVGGPGD